MSRDGVGQTAGLIDAGQRRQDLGRHLLVELDVVFELGDHRPLQYIDFPRVGVRIFFDQANIGREIVTGVRLYERGTRTAFDEHLDGAVRQFQQLQDRRQRSEFV